jgi:outer membrane protein, heavy metal efflux system
MESEMRLTLASLLLLIAACFASAALAADATGLEATLDGLVQEALQNNPDLLAGRERWEMFGHKVAPAQALDDPTLGLALSNYPSDSFKADQTPMTGNELQLAQKFPFPGKLAAKGEVAQQQARWYQAVYEDSRLQLANKVKEVFYRLYFLDRALAVTEENLQLLDSFVSLTTTRYEVGRGLQQDVLKAQVEQSKLMDKQLELRQQRQSAQAELNRLLARPATTPLDLRGELDLIPVAADLEQLKVTARQHRPLFAAYEAQIRNFSSQRELARLDYYPNFNLWASYRFRDDGLPDGGTNFVSAGVSLNLPLWQEKRSEAVADADAGIRMARRQSEDFANMVDFTLEDSLARLQRNTNQVELYRTGIIPQAQQSFDASLTAYQVGKVELLSLLDSLMTLYRYQIDEQRALTDALRDAARLEAASGVSLAPGSAAAEQLNRNGLKP